MQQALETRRLCHISQALAAQLGDSAVALMRGHGNVVVGRSIQQVVFRAIYTENNARLQSEAMRLGEINFLTPEEARATSDMNDQHLDRPWQMWKQRVRATHTDPQARAAR